MPRLGDVPQPYVAEFCKEGARVFANPVGVYKPWDEVGEDDGRWNSIGGCLKVDMF